MCSVGSQASFDVLVLRVSATRKSEEHSANRRKRPARFLDRTFSLVEVLNFSATDSFERGGAR